jgi:hypothetical protein
MTIKESGRSSHRPPSHPDAADSATCSGGVASDLRRRREASYRLPVLECGRSDPWYYDEPELSENQLDAWEAAAAHLLEQGMVPLVPADPLRELWQRRGSSRALAELLHRRYRGESR